MNVDVPAAIVITVDRHTRIELNRAGRQLGYGGCGRCCDSWLWKPSHATEITSWDGVFPLCEDCWKALTPEERLPFYRAMFEQNLATCPGDYIEQYKAQWPLIEKAVKEGK
jgi:hypothetical protein